MYRQAAGPLRHGPANGPYAGSRRNTKGRQPQLQEPRNRPDDSVSYLGFGLLGPQSPATSASYPMYP
jgi:hypothetical protein